MVMVIKTFPNNLSDDQGSISTNASNVADAVFTLWRLIVISWSTDASKFALANSNRYCDQARNLTICQS